MPFNNVDIKEMNSISNSLIYQSCDILWDDVKSIHMLRNKIIHWFMSLIVSHKKIKSLC